MLTVVRGHPSTMHRLFSVVLAFVLILTIIPLIHYPVSAQADEENVSRGIKAGSIYDFSSGAGVDKWAYYGTDANGAPPAITQGTLFPSYTEIASSNDVRYSTGGGSVTKDPYHLFKFIISEASSTITNLTLCWEGYNDAGTSNFYIWNFASSAWELLGSHTQTATDGAVIVSKTTDFSNYINSSKCLYLCAIETSNSGITIYTDYIYVSVVSESSVNFTFSMQPGWNLIILPVYNNSLTTAEQLCDAIPCNYVGRWYSSFQGWEMHERNKTENNFVLENGTGYFVYLGNSKDFTIEGKELPGVEINLKKGWNSVGWYENNATYPQKIMGVISNSSSVAYWNTALSRFVVCLKGAGMTNFSIPEGTGLFVYTEIDSTWDTLPTITSVEHDAPSVLGPHGKFNVTIKGDTGYTATFDVESVATGVTMTEEAPGFYKGSYTVSPSDKSGSYNIIGHLSSHRTTVSKNADTTITIDATPPTISSVTSGNINDTSATINWTTDEASNSIVEYGTTAGSYPNSTWNATAVTKHQINLTSLKPGTKYYYIVKSQDAAGNQATSAEYNFTTTGSSLKILLVDDDNGKTYESKFQTSLTNNGYIYDNWCVNTDGSPSSATLSTYNVVIWFTSEDYSSTLTTTDKNNLASYLNSGGKLFITGQDIGYDIASDSDNFYGNYLHASYVADDSGGTAVDGVAGDPISNGYSNLAITGSYPSEISPKDDYASECFVYKGTAKVAGIKAGTGTYRVVYLACMYFETTDANKDSVMKKIIDWLIAPPDTTPPTFTGIKYVNNTIYTGTLNLSWDPASDPGTPITYNIYQATTSGGQNFSKANYTTLNTKYKVSGLTNGVTYYFVVRAKDNLGNEDTNTVEKSGKPTGTQTPTQKYALIVGISDYKSISDLSYCDEDANDWYYYLTNSKTSSTPSEGDFTYAFGETFDHIWVYGDKTSSYAKYDGVATEYNVKQALRSIVENATSSDLILFASSGHGSSSGGKSYLCMWDSGAGENGENGNLYDDELSAILKNAAAARIFVFIDHCNSGHFCNELSTMPNAANVFVATTCTINGYGYDDSGSKNGAFTNWFLNKGLRNGQSGNATNQNMEANFKWVDDNYPYTGNDNPCMFDGNTSKLFYLKD